eukprot:5342350-Amphidinium_carterae.1
MSRLSSGRSSANSYPHASQGLGDMQDLLCSIAHRLRPLGSMSRGSKQGAPCPHVRVPPGSTRKRPREMPPAPAPQTSQ